MDFERKQAKETEELLGTVDWELDFNQVPEEEEKPVQMNEVRYANICSAVRGAITDGWYTVEEVAQHLGLSNVTVGHAIETVTKNTQNVLSARVANGVVYRMGRPRN